MKTVNKIIFTLLVLFSAVSANAQIKNFGTVRNLINADNKQYHFGFILGFNSMDFNLDQTNHVAEDDGKIWYADVTNQGVGFTVGIISDLRLGRYFNLRFDPVLLFNDRTVHYVDKDGNAAEEDVVVKSTIIDFPLLMKARAARMGNLRPYLLAGPAMTLDLGRSTDANLLLKGIDYGVEFGFGCDIYLTYFKLAPEFKMFLGFNELLDTNRPELEGTKDIKWQQAIGKLTSRIFTLTFNFE